MPPTSPTRAPLPTVRLVERRHRLAPLPGVPLRLPVAQLAGASRALAAGLIGLWPVTAVVAIAAALVATAGGG